MRSTNPGFPCDRPIASFLGFAAVLATTAATFASPAPAAAMPPAAIDAWVPGGKLTVAGNVTETVRSGWRYGFAVAMNDRYAVIGAPDTPLRRANGTVVNGAGSAYVFKRTPGTDTWTFMQRLIAPELSLCQTGCAVAIDPGNDDIIVGAWAYGGAATFGGGAFVYSKDPASDSWGIETTLPSTGNDTRMPSQELLPSDLQAIDQFGFSIAIDDGTAVIGAPLAGSSNTGAAYVFVRNGSGEWEQKQKLTDPAGGSNDQLGTKVAVSGNLAVAGIQNDDVYGKVNAGSAVVFKRANATAGFASTGRILPGTITAGAQFGAAIAVLDGATDYLVVGAPTDTSDNTAGNGAAYVFSSADGATWTEDATLLPRIANVNNNFGYSVAMGATEPPAIVVGAPGYDTALETGDVDAPYAQIVNAGAGFCFAKQGAAWAIRGGASTGDLWSPSIVTANTSIGRTVAIAPGDPDFSIVGGETPTSSTGNAWTFSFGTGEVGTDPGDVAGPAAGPLGEDGLPQDGSTPGNGDNGTGGGVNGGGAPSGGTDTSGGVVIPLTPIVYQWGTIKGSAIAIKGRKVAVLQTDGKHVGNAPKFRPLATLPAGSAFVGVGDMNGDRSGDVLFVAPGRVLKYWQRDGLAVRDTKTIDSLPPNMNVVAVADFNGDSKADILLRSSVDPRELMVWFMSAGAISSSTEYTLPPGNWSITVGKFRSATGAADILLRDVAQRSLLLLRDASGTVTFPALADRGPRWRVLAVADFTGDSQVDILWGDGGSIELDVYGTNDAGAYVVTRRERTGLGNASVLDARDWNGDGKTDLWMRSGNRNWIQYTTYTVRLFPNGSRDLGNAPGTVVGVAER
jgi:hypothetical protein